MFNWSEVHLYQSNFLQNPYFKKSAHKKVKKRFTNSMRGSRSAWGWLELYGKPKETQRKPKKKYFCHLCNFKSSQDVELGNHLTQNHIVQCQICDFKTIDQEFLSRHTLYLIFLHKHSSNMLQNLHCKCFDFLAFSSPRSFYG